jgi:type I restriction enzyme S subunit
MEVKPGYKQTDIGALPGDWRVAKIKDVASITTGKRNTQDRIEDGLYPFFVRSQTVERINSFSFDGEAVLTAGDGVGTGKVFHYINGKFDFHQRVYKLADFSADLNGFFFHLYFSTHFYDRIMSMTAKSSVDSVRLETIAGMQIPLPPLPEQRAIAGALSDVDALLGALDQLIAKKRDLKQAAMQQLLTGQTRLPGFHGEWEVKRLGDHVTFLRNGVNSRAELLPEGRVRYLHYGDVHACKDTDLSPDSLPFLPDAKAVRLDRLRDGDLIFADASEDIAGVSKSVELRGIGNTEVVPGLHTIAARFDKTVLADGFKGFLQSCPPFATHLRRLAAGTKVYATNRAHIASVEMRLPRGPEQVAIAAVLSDMESELAALEARRLKTRDLKQAMMQELLTGKTRLVSTRGAHV